MPFDEKKRTAAVFHIERRVREEEKAFAYKQEGKVVLLWPGLLKAAFSTDNLESNFSSLLL